jgi:tetratricopeptide (TPR) repeat protein
MKTATFLLIATAVAPAAETPDLSKFEAAILAEPNNIRNGNEYRKAVIATKEYDRALKFFEKLVADNPKAGNAYLNYGFVYVDKIPVAGSITQVILANTALAQFSKSIELEPSWIGYYTRGNSYLYWPKIFGRAKLGVADLEKAMDIMKKDKVRSFHVRGFIALGDGYWKMDEPAKAKATWSEGVKQFPGNQALKARLSRDGEDLTKYIDEVLDPNKRVDTDLHELWEAQ